MKTNEKNDYDELILGVILKTLCDMQINLEKAGLVVNIDNTIGVLTTGILITTQKLIEAGGDQEAAIGFVLDRINATKEYLENFDNIIEEEED